ncbi:MAG TPA: hypothetical protein RMH26_18160, partial [Polyangiaceae bacterium LLY-WYZ-15_(1-7)]|nr:hypothetical protein [Polyangiaceae bacterium LLY-WYZ-15_(1-7)]
MPGEQLDARLLRFRNDPRSDDPMPLARELLEAGRAAEALEVAAARLRADPRDADALVLAGRAYLGRDELLRAQKTLLQAARQAPNRPEPYRWLGEVLLKRGDPERAQKVLARARGLGASGPDFERLLGRAQRLARIAGNADAVPSVPAPAPEPDSEPITQEREVDDEDDDAATVVRSDLQAQLREAISAADAGEDPFADEDDDEGESTVVASDLSKKIAAAARTRGEEDDLPPRPAVDDDAPTSMMSRQNLDLDASIAKAKEKARRRAPAAAPPPVADDPFGSDPFGEPAPTSPAHRRAKSPRKPAAPPR